MLIVCCGISLVANLRDCSKTVFDTCRADHPVIAQFCGNDPALLLEAAKMVEDHVDARDQWCFFVCFLFVFSPRSLPG
jgi:tRNA-dihydrouridine synthase